MNNNIIDLFSGCGGFSLGAELAGFNTSTAIDIDANLQSSYKKNFPNSNVINTDIFTLNRSFWKQKLNGKKPAGVIGGPPCQGFSYMGKRNKKDPRNDLIAQFYKQVSIINPKYFIMENVQGLMNESNVDLLHAGINSLPKRFRVLEPMIINAADYGAATNRKRVVVIGYDPEYVDHLKSDDFFPTINIKQVNVRDAIFDLPKPLTNGLKNDYHWGNYPKVAGRRKYYSSKCRSIPTEGLGWNESISKLKNGMTSGLSPTKHSEQVIKRFRNTPPGQTDKISKFPRLQWDGKCPTLRAGTGREHGGFQSVRPIHPSQNRVITVREAARLQGFPDWFIFHHAKWHSFRMIGNSVCPPVSEYLHKVIYSKINN